MSRKTVERYLLWSAIQETEEFSIPELVDRVETVTRRPTWEYCKALHAGGYLEITGNNSSRLFKGDKRSVVYRLVRNTGPEAPQVDKSGGVIFDPNLSRPDPSGRLWRVMKILPVFTVNELELCADLDELGKPRYFIQRYVHNLFLAGFLQFLSCYASGKLRHYRLCRNTGPIAPLVCRERVQLFDPNTKTFYDISRQSNAPT